MPLLPETQLSRIAEMLPRAVDAYNVGAKGPAYNESYNTFIAARTAGLAANATITGWIDSGDAAMRISVLLNLYGMNARNSKLLSIHVLEANLANLPAASVNWIQGVSLPVAVPPAAMINPTTGVSLAAELSGIYNYLSEPWAVTVSGGFVASSKTMHCLFPNLIPMIDGAHTGLSYHNIVRDTYLPPLGLASWEAWLGWPMNGTRNPSPRGAGRHAWGADQLLAAVGVNQHIYETWNAANEMAGLPGFLALDPTPGTTGIPRIVDKGLW